MYCIFRLIQDRDLQLHDGTRLLRSDRYDKLVKKLGAEVMEKSNIIRVHPAFRIIALAEPPGNIFNYLVKYKNKRKIIKLFKIQSTISFSLCHLN